MVKPLFSQQSKLHYQLRQLGWQGVLGLILIATSILLVLLVVIPNSNKRDLLMMRFAELQADKANGKARSTLDEKFDAVAQLNILLPTQDDANNKIAQVLRIAADGGLVTDKVDYSSQPYSASMLKYQIKLPAQGSYVQIRQFINAVLNALPTLALADIEFKREDIGSELVDASIQFNLYVNQTARPSKMRANKY